MEARALYNGASGMQSNSVALASAADNIANINTYGYKAYRSNFSDLLYQSLSTGSVESDQVGNGTVATMQNIMNQGALEDTDNALDMAVDGNGFFTVSDPALAGSLYYTRAGQFYLDKDGYLVNDTGYRVQGFGVAEDGTVSVGGLMDIQIPMDLTDQAATSRVDLIVNLDASDTQESAEGVAIDPSDDTTYNYSMGYEVYDAAGETHEVSLYYQKMESFSGPSPTGSSQVYQVASFETEDGVISENPAYPNNVFYLHFDTNGHLVGTTTGTAASGDVYQSDAEVTDTASAVSDRLGESLTYTGAGAAQEYLTSATVTFTGVTAAGDALTVGTDTYSLTAGLSASDAAAELAGLINQNSAAGYYATDDGAGGVTIHAKGTGSYDLALTGSSATLDDDTTLAELVSSLNNGQAASGSIYLDLAGMTAGTSSVTVDGNTFVYGAGNDFTTAAELATLVDGLAGVGATSSGDSVYLAAEDLGTAGNAITLATSDATNVTVSGNTLLGGLDDDATNEVVASAVAGDTGYLLELGRTDTGTAATLGLSGSNTLGAGLGLDFNAYTQTASAADANYTASDTGEVPLTYTFSDTDPDTLVTTSTTQQITLDFAPEDMGYSTMSAGSYGTSYLDQDGAAEGTVTSVRVDDDGVIYASFSNGEEEAVAAVALTTFNSPESLTREGDNLWSANTASGPAKVGQAGDEVLGMGDIQGAALESSSVDLANEFVNLINYQRAYQLNGKSITTADEMLQTAINMKS